MRLADGDSEDDDLHKPEDEIMVKKEGKLVTTAMIKTWSKGLQVFMNLQAIGNWLIARLQINQNNKLLVFVEKLIGIIETDRSGF